MEDMILVEKRKLFKYSFYDDSNKLNVVLDEDYIKKLFEADILLWDEPEHK